MYNKIKIGFYGILLEEESIFFFNLHLRINANVDLHRCLKVEVVRSTPVLAKTLTFFSYVTKLLSLSLSFSFFIRLTNKITFSI